MARRRSTVDDTMPNDVTSLAVMVGEIRGQMREVVHTLNNVSAKIDGLSREVIAMGPLAADIAELRGDLKLARNEIELLKETKYKTEGATGLINWVFKNWPGIMGFILLVGLILKVGGYIK
jgi:rubrerythrin